MNLDHLAEIVLVRSLHCGCSCFGVILPGKLVFVIIY
jgi:hypothetical protein